MPRLQGRMLSEEADPNESVLTLSSDEASGEETDMPDVPPEAAGLPQGLPDDDRVETAHESAVSCGSWWGKR